MMHGVDCMVHSEYPMYFTADLTGAIVPQLRGALPASACKVLTPLKVASWADALKYYPDRELAEYLLRGIDQGFHIGFDYSRYCCEKAKSNMMSAVHNAKVVEDYLQPEVKLG